VVFYKLKGIPLEQRTTKEKVMLVLSAIATFCIAVFSGIRFYNNEINMALLDLFIAVSTFGFFIFVFFTRKVEAANLILSIFLLMAVLLTIALKDEFQIHWMYLVIIALYYLLAPKKAMKLISISLLIMGGTIYSQSSFVHFFSVMVTTSLTTVFCYIIFKSYFDKQQQLIRLSTIDPLTLVGNRRALDKKLLVIIKSQQRQQYDMCLLLIDVDYFKKINDNNGHSVGDDVLVTLSSLLKENIRALDDIYRYGGEEFIIIPQSMALECAELLATKLRVLVESHTFPENINLTISIGVAQYKQHETAEKWISRADTALYKAKKEGRNQVCVFDE
jgi:diguanylate cyclase (GGDEF)-like protein